MKCFTYNLSNTVFFELTQKIMIYKFCDNNLAHYAIGNAT